MSEYWVDPNDGCDTTGDGTKEKPFKTTIRVQYEALNRESSDKYITISHAGRDALMSEFHKRYTK